MTTTMKHILTQTAGLAVGLLIGLTACSNEIEMRRPPVSEEVEIPEVGNIHTFKAPLYWSIYEYCYDLEQKGIPASAMDFTPEQWDEVIEWMSKDLVPAGYNMVCTDGFIPMNANDASGYMTHYGSTSLADLVAKCAAKGIGVGVYDNPLWIHGDKSTVVEGTRYTFGDLTFDGSQTVMNPQGEDMWFTWVVADKPGAREYIDGFFKHYAELGIKFIRMDFLSWYEDGKDRGMGTVGLGYGRENYVTALNYIAQSAQKYGIFTSLVMPHLNQDAAAESQLGNMVRIVADTGNGGWSHFSSQNQGESYSSWPNCNNMFDGFIYWSHISGPENVILDGDFTRLNKFSSADEKQSVVSLQILAGGPVAVADQPSTIGGDVEFYTNPELLALNAERFVGKPLSDSLNDENSQIWTGTCRDGSVVVGIFNRGGSADTRHVDFARLGLEGEHLVHDMWTHRDEGNVASIDVTLPPHGCKILKIS